MKCEHCDDEAMTFVRISAEFDHDYEEEHFSRRFHVCYPCGRKAIAFVKHLYEVDS